MIIRCIYVLVVIYFRNNDYSLRNNSYNSHDIYKKKHAKLFNLHGITDYFLDNSYNYHDICVAVNTFLLQYLQLS